MPRAKSKSKDHFDPATKAFNDGLSLVRAHPLFSAFAISISRKSGYSSCPSNGMAIVFPTGSIDVHPTLRLEPQEWAWTIAHSLLHLGFGHLRTASVDEAEQVARCVVVCRFLSALKFGKSPILTPELPNGDEDSIANALRHRLWTIPIELVSTTGGNDIGGTGIADRPERFEQHFAEGLEAAVSASLDYAAGEIGELGAPRKSRSAWQRALHWFVGNYPLLGALAASFTIEEDPELCERAGISVAAISPATQTLFLRGDVRLREEERRFVIAHELLHAGLRHDTRGGGRDPWLWNVACDYVINDWLVQMGVGEIPDGALYDPELKGLSAEAVYDRVVTDLRRHRKARTFAGIGVPDMVAGRLFDAACGVTLDEFYRRALQQGLEMWRNVGRGFVPAGLVEEIRALAHPPVPWDVELARWFEHHIPSAQRTRSYARLSRRQSSTPDIPRPAYIRPYEPDHKRTFGVVLDTSGSMDARVLGRALGAIASYAVAREVQYARVVFCDAVAYDAGWLDVTEIAGRVRVRGRGGTILQPGIDLLERAEDFPSDGPILIITDGECDRLRIPHEHAFLTPSGARLPFVPIGPVFRMPSVGSDRESDPSNQKQSR
jgi:predicted metal-dependent peptidase